MLPILNVPVQIENVLKKRQAQGGSGSGGVQLADGGSGDSPVAPMSSIMSQ